MQQPASPQNEKQRLAALRQLQLLDTSAEDRFDRLTRLACAMFDVPIALVSLVDTNRQWFKSKQGLDACETSREISFCGHAILSQDIFYIPNALEDPRFADNPLVTGPPDIRMYAGAPLSDSKGLRVGTLCIIDVTPRHFSAEELRHLRDLADCVEEEINKLNTKEAQQIIHDQEARLHALVETVVDGIISIDRQGIIQTVNPAAKEIFGYSSAEMVGQNVKMLMPEPYASEHDDYLTNFYTTGDAKVIGIGREVVGQRKDGSTFPLELAVSEMEVHGELMFTGIVRDITQRKQAEQALHDSEAETKKLAMVVARTDNSVVITDADGMIEWVNKGFERTTGYCLAEVIGKKPGDVMQGPNTDPETIAYMREHIQRGEGFNCEIINYRKDGTPYWLQLDVRPIADETGRLINFIAIESDISERKRTEEDIIRYANAMELLHIVTSNIDMPFDNRVQALLELGRQTFDLPLGIVSQINGDCYTVKYILGPDEAPPVNTEFQLGETYCVHTMRAAQPTGFHHAGESEIKTHPCYLNFGLESYIGVPILVAGKPYGTLNFSGPEPKETPYSETDYSLIQLFSQWLGNEIERLQTEKEIREGTERIRSIVDTVVDGIITINDKGIIESFNPAAEKIFQYKAVEVVGNNVKMLMPEPYRQEHDGYIDNYLSSNNAKVIGIGREVTGRRQDGSTFPMDLAVSEMDINGKNMYTGIVRDITERKEVERLKSEFISTVSHELRTPLTSIRGALGVVLGKAADGLSAKAKRMLENANRNSERLTLLINDILDLEKIESGKLEFEFEEIDLAELSRSALEANQEYARQHDVSLNMYINLDKAIVWGDSHRLMQVYANFISNAVKYSPANAEVEVAVIQHGNGFRVGIRDFGRGIPDEFRDRIFHRFAQADSSDTRDKGGTGLGLSITKAIIERLGGQVGYESQLGEGSLFYFDLPELREVIENTTKNTAESNVLICEDNIDVAELLVEMVEQEGTNSDIATTAAGAKKLLANKSYRLLLLDLTLPDMDGLELLHEIRDDEKFSDMQIIVVSGRADEGKRIFNGEAISVVDWLQKPIDEKRFNRALQQALQGGDQPKVLHVEDDRDIIQITESLLEETTDYHYVTTLEQARKYIEKDHVDLVLLDLSLPDGSGLELLKEIKGRFPVVVFSGAEPSKELNEQVVAMLTKSKTTNDQLLATIKQALNS